MRKGRTRQCRSAPASIRSYTRSGRLACEGGGAAGSETVHRKKGGRLARGPLTPTASARGVTSLLLKRSLGSFHVRLPFSAAPWATNERTASASPEATAPPPPSPTIHNHYTGTPATHGSMRTIKWALLSFQLPPTSCSQPQEAVRAVGGRQDTHQRLGGGAPAVLKIGEVSERVSLKLAL